MKVFFTSFLLLVCISVVAQSKKEIAIAGSFPKEAGKSIIISGANHFKKEVTADASGSFKTIFKAEPGYYLVKSGVSAYFIYAEPGFNLVLGKTDSTSSFNGKGSEQNNLIKQVNRLSKEYLETNSNLLPAKITALEPTDFKTRLDNYREAGLKLLAAQNFGDFFNKTQTDYLEYRIKEYALTYMERYGVDPEKEKEAMTILLTKSTTVTQQERMTRFSAAYTAMHVKTMSIDDRTQIEQRIWENFDLNNEVMYSYSPAYNRLLDLRITQLLNGMYASAPYLRPKNINENKYDLVKKEITNPVVKQTQLTKYMALILKTGKEIDKYYLDYTSTVTDPVYLAEIKAIYDNMQLYVPGSRSPDFAYNDMQGNKVTLSSFKGSYVYIDIWAQWCGPCKAEIPSLKQVEKKYEGQNIKFVSLSIDKQEDIDKWKKYVTDNNLSGVQVIADKEWQSDFTKRYNVNSIPRFILIDPDGKIVSADADRPSNPKLQTLLDKLLSKS